MKKEYVILIVALTLCGGLMVCGVLGGLVAAFLASQYQAQPVASVQYVLVAAVELPVGTVLDEPEKQLAAKLFPSDSVPPGAFVNIEDLRGKVLARTIERNWAVTAKDLSIVGDLFKGVPPGLRAMTIRVKSVAKFLPGSRVDIIGIEPAIDDPAKLVPRVIVENALILATSTVRRDTNIKMADGDLLTIAVTVEQAEKLAAAGEHGPFTIVFRRPGE